MPDERQYLGGVSQMNKSFNVLICFSMVALVAAVSTVTLMLKDSRELSGAFKKGTADEVEQTKRIV